MSKGAELHRQEVCFHLPYHAEKGCLSKISRKALYTTLSPRPTSGWSFVARAARFSSTF